MTYAVILFVILFIVSTTLAILFYKDNEDLKNQAQQARAQLNAFVNSGESQLDEVLKLRDRANASGVSVFGQLLRDHQGLVGTVNGNAKADIDAVYADLKAQGVADGQTVVGLLQNRADELDKSQKLVASLEDQVKAGEKQLATLDELYQKQQAQYKTLDQKLTGRIDQLDSDFEGYQQQVESQQQVLSSRLQEKTQEVADTIRQNDTRMKQLEKDNSGLQQRVRDLIGETKKDTPQVPDASANVDGHIIAINNEDNLVYLDLGQADHLVLGMTFEVFDALRGVQVDDDSLRGKATLEVVDIQETSAAARVIRSSFSRPILPGDLIANLVYDRNHTFKFYVFGEFDLDGDGQYTIADHDSVISMIQKWGGTVVDPDQRRESLEGALGEEVAANNQLPLDVDFVLIGAEPATPIPPGRNEQRDVVAITQYQNALQRWQQYNDIKQEAKTLSVPVINQNRFLALIGHTN
jgi:hypothetical protein